MAHAKEVKGKGGKFHNHKHQGRRPSPSPNQKEKKKDLSHVQCFRSKKYGHYVNKCPSSNKRKHEASNVDVDEFTPHKRPRNDDPEEST